MKSTAIILAVLAFPSSTFFAAEPIAPAEQLPGLAATEPADAAATFRLKKGFHIELAAAEPQVVDPVSMAC